MIYMKKKTKNITNQIIQACPECGSTHIITDYARAEILCDDCGLIIQDKLISYEPTGHIEISKILIHNKTFAIGVNQINKIASQLGLPQYIKETAIQTYKKIMTKQLIKQGTNIENIATTTVYIATRIHAIPRTLTEIALISQINRTILGRTYKRIQKQLGIKIHLIPVEKYIRTFALQLNLNANIENKAFQILKQINEQNLTSGMSPNAVAILILYIATKQYNKRANARKFAKIANVTDRGIRQKYKKMIRNLKI